MIFRFVLQNFIQMIKTLRSSDRAVYATGVTLILKAVDRVDPVVAINVEYVPYSTYEVGGDVEGLYKLSSAIYLNSRTGK